MKTISLKIPQALDARVSAVARRRRMSKSALIRQALAAFVARPNGRREVSALEAAGDLVGCLEGPGDLSFNPKYMKDYGR